MVSMVAQRAIDARPERERAGHRWDVHVGSLPNHHDVVILPQSLNGERGICRDEQLMIKKQLSAMGVDADYAHDQDHRDWLGLRGDVVAAITLGLLTSGGVAASPTHETPGR